MTRQKILGEVNCSARVILALTFLVFFVACFTVFHRLVYFQFCSAFTIFARFGQQKRYWNCAAAGHLSEAEQQAGDGALLDVQRQQGVGHVDEEHGAPHAGVGRPRVAVQHYQHLATHRVTGCEVGSSWSVTSIPKKEASTM